MIHFVRTEVGASFRQPDVVVYDCICYCAFSAYPTDMGKTVPFNSYPLQHVIFLASCEKHGNERTATCFWMLASLFDMLCPCLPPAGLAVLTDGRWSLLLLMQLFCVQIFHHVDLMLTRHSACAVLYGQYSPFSPPGLGVPGFLLS